jgi:hypothetical protein
VSHITVHTAYCLVLKVLGHSYNLFDDLFNDYLLCRFERIIDGEDSLMRRSVQA